MKLRKPWSVAFLVGVVFFLFHLKEGLWQSTFAGPGTIAGCITAPGNCNWFEAMGYEVILYDSGWNIVQTKGTDMFGLWPFCYFYYAFENLTPGTYYVWAQAWGRFSQHYGPTYLWNRPWRPSYYPGVLRSANATPIVVEEDQTVDVAFSLLYTSYILIGTNPPGYSVIADNVAYSSPKYFEWTEGDVHTIGVEEYYVNSDSTRSYFREWRHGGPRIQNYTVPPATHFGDVPDTLIARFDYYYQLKVLSRYGHPQGGGWHKAWEKVTISVEDSVIEYTDMDSILHVFDHWAGTGYGAYTGRENPATFALNSGDVVERVVWRDQYPLVVEVNDTSLGRVEVIPSGTWQDKDSTVFLKALPKPGCTFIEWQGDASGSSDTASLVMDTSKVILAQFSRVNHPPQVSMPDTGFAEDDTLAVSYGFLSTWITDPDHAFLELAIQFSSTVEHFHWRLTPFGVLIWADPDWNGLGWIVVEVRDPLGATAMDTVYCTVDPVNDAPKPFDLVFPEEAYMYEDTSMALEFRWNQSRNVDAMNGDSIRYTLYLETKEGQRVFMAVVDDTAFTYSSSKDLANGEYVWKVKAEDSEGLSVWSTSSRNLKVDVESAVKTAKSVPVAFRLYPNYPNPFNAGTAVSFDVPRRERVRVAVYSSTGLLLKILLDRNMEPGSHRVVWDGTDSAGDRAGSGMYILKMTAGNWTGFIKMTLLK